MYLLSDRYMRALADLGGAVSHLDPQTAAM